MRAGERVGPFDIEKELGSGAMGAVYRARYRKTGQRVAIKIMAPGLGVNRTALARFEREAEVLKQFNHPNIVRFYAASQHEGSPYYAMEYIEGETLDAVLARKGRFTWEEVVELGTQVCAGLKHAHDQGIVHRDLKPSNLMIMKDGTCKLTDFGIAKDLDMTALTSAHCTVGTAAYMSPEQCRGERNLTHKSDLYSLGVVLYELLTGKKPFMADTTMDMFLLHVNGTFERPSRQVLDIPIWLDTLVCQLLEKTPERRPFDAAVVEEALERVAEKVMAQRSAGVDAAQARGADRPLGETRIDAADKNAARSLRESVRRRRRRQRTSKPFYEKGWFQAIGIIAVLVAIVAMIYVAFRPPRAETLFQQAQKLMASENFTDKEVARKGPVALFLHHYGDLNDERAIQVHRWADEVDMEQKWRGLKNRRRAAMAASGEAELTARNALGAEEAGELDYAYKQWQELLKFKQAGDPEERVWGILADRRIGYITEGQYHEAQVRERLQQARNLGQEFKTENQFEQLAADAVRFEDFGDFPSARDRWRELLDKSDKDKDGQPGWSLLAHMKIRQLKTKMPAEDAEKGIRYALIEKALAEADKLVRARPSAARVVYLDIVSLYEKSIDPEVLRLRAIAQERLKKLPTETAP
jgi:serine/threonine-protein kinase